MAAPCTSCGHDVDALSGGQHVRGCPQAPLEARAMTEVVQIGAEWPAAVSDGVGMPCSDCGEEPRFDYRVTEEFWREWVPEKPARLSVVCLPCLDCRCDGVGLAAALVFVQWTGTGHTVELLPARRFEYAR